MTQNPVEGQVNPYNTTTYPPPSNEPTYQSTSNDPQAEKENSETLDLNSNISQDSTNTSQNKSSE